MVHPSVQKVKLSRRPSHLCYDSWFEREEQKEAINGESASGDIRCDNDRLCDPIPYLLVNWQIGLRCYLET